MDRRELIKLVTMATGAALAVPLSSTLLTACSKVENTKEEDYALNFFSEEEFSSLKNLLDFILPKTDSPSAVEVGVHMTIDNMVGLVYNPEERKKFRTQFDSLKAYGSSSDDLDKLKNVLTSGQEEDQEVKSAFLALKQQAVAYYLSTEEIGTKYLNYLPIPGKYEPCISLESVGGKAWAL